MTSRQTRLPRCVRSSALLNRSARSIGRASFVSASCRASACRAISVTHGAKPSGIPRKNPIRIKNQSLSAGIHNALRNACIAPGCVPANRLPGRQPGGAPAGGMGFALAASEAHDAQPVNVLCSRSMDRCALRHAKSCIHSGICELPHKLTIPGGFAAPAGPREKKSTFPRPYLSQISRNLACFYKRYSLCGNHE